MKWTFEQIEGPSSDRKTLELSGWNAPFGRPRKDPILREVIKSRVQTTRYPHSNNQTRHAFGTNWEPIELKGRWMTKELLDQGLGANDFADSWIAFVQDERTIRIAWGFILSYTGFIEELEIARESEDEIAWRMKILIDKRDELLVSIPQDRLAPVSDGLVDVNAFMKSGKPPNIDGFNPDFLDEIDEAFDTLNRFASIANIPSATLNKLAGRFDDIEKASFATIQHFRGSITGLRTGIIAMRDVVLDGVVDAMIIIRTAESDIEWAKYQTDFDVQTAFILDILNKMDRRAELALDNEATKFVLAKQGDTWESISTRATGGPDKANSIRSLNGARYGQKPEPGQSYLVQ